MKNYKMNVIKQTVRCMALLVYGSLWAGYVNDGLVLHYDAIDNAGIGKHEANPEKWVDLTGSGADMLSHDKIAVGADFIAFNKVKRAVTGVEIVETNLSDYTLEIVARTDESFDPGYTRRFLVQTDRLGLYFRRVMDGELIGLTRSIADGRQLSFAPIDKRCADWNNLPFVRSFHTYSIQGASIAIDSDIYQRTANQLTTSVTNGVLDKLVLGDSGCNFIFRSIRLYNRRLSEEEMRQNRMEDAARFSSSGNWKMDPNTATNVFSDAIYYFRGADATESETFHGTNTVANALWAGVADHPPCNEGTIDGDVSNIAVEKMDVKCPYSRKTLKDCSVLRFLQREWVDSDGALKASSTRYYQNVNGNFTNTAPYTVALRFKIESAMYPGANIRLLQLGYSGNCGMDVVLQGDDTNMCVSVTRAGKATVFNKMQKHPAFCISRGKWVDLSIAVSGRETRLYFRTEDGDMFEEILGGGGTSTDDTRFYRLTLGGVKKGAADRTEINHSFRGWIQQVAVWGRELSRDEVLQAFCDGYDEYDAVRVGVPNGGNCEFAGEGTICGDNGRVWRSLTNALDSAGDSIKVCFDLPSGKVAFARDIRLAATPFYADESAVKVTLNGLTVADSLAMTAGKTAVANIPASYFRQTGNEIEIVRIDEGAERMEIDYIAVTAARSVNPVTPVASSDDIYSQAYFWHIGAQDNDENGWLFPSGNSESQRTTHEFRDVLNGAIANSPSHEWTRPVDGGNSISASNYVVTACTVKCPAANLELQGENCLRFTCPSYCNSSGELVSTFGSVYRQIFPATNSVGYSVLMRLKFDGYINPTNKIAGVMAYGYNYTGQKGVRLYLKGDEDNMYVNMWGGAATKMDFMDTQTGEAVNRLKSGEWMDVGITVSNGWFRLYTFTEGGSLVEQKKQGGSSALGVQDSSDSRFAFGYLEDSSKLNTAGSANGFRGMFHQVAVWPRVLTKEEMLKAMKWPRPDIFRLGVFNMRPHEFSGGDAKITDVYRFRNVSSAIRKSGDSYEIEFDLDEADASQNQLLTIAAVEESVEDAAFAVELNGERIYNYDIERNQVITELSVEPGAKARFGIHRSWLKSGRNSLTLTRMDGKDGVFVMDAMSFGNGGEKVKVRTRLGFFAISIR